MFRRLFFLFPLVALSLLLPASARASASICGSGLANHVYVNSFGGLINYPQYFMGLGYPVPSGSGLEPNAGAGQLTFTSSTNFVYKESLAIANLGLYQDSTIQGTYSLSLSPTGACTGTMTGTANLRGLVLPFNYQFVVSNDTYRLSIMNTTTGLLIDFTSEGLTPGPAVTCSNSSLNSTGYPYSYAARGWSLAPPNSPSGQMLGGYIALAITGSLNFTSTPAAATFPSSPAGADLVTAADTVTINGTKDGQRTVTGWYIVNANCTGTMLLQSQGYPTMTFELFPSYENLTVRAVDVDPQVTVSGNNTPPVILSVKFTRNDASVPQVP